MNIESENPIYSELLVFYKKILDIRVDYLDRLHAAITPIAINDHILKSKIKEGFPLIDIRNLQTDYPLMSTYFLKLLAIVDGFHEKDTEKLTALACEPNEFKTVIEKTLQGETHTDYPNVLPFFLEETIHPIFEVHASFLKDRTELTDWVCGYCPICGMQPILGYIKGEEGKKYLICKACDSKWSFPRIKCPCCGTNDPIHLSYLTSKEDSRHRIEICDNCQNYLKVIDLRSTDQNIDASIENLLTLHLDIIARKKGYTNTNSSFYGAIRDEVAT